MRKPALIAAALSLLAVSCVKPEPSWKMSWDNTPVPGEPPAQQEEPEQEPESPPEYELAVSFSQTFDTASPRNFSFDLHDQRDDFRYFPAFPSLSERSTDILLVRLDPADESGKAGGPRVSLDSLTFYGSYSIRVRLPDISRIKTKPDVVFEFGLSGQPGKTEEDIIALRWKLSSPQSITLCSKSVSKAPDGLPKGFDASAGFYEYGFDWSADRLQWWIKDPAAKKTVIGEMEGTASIPQTPGFICAGAWHTSAAPEYPFEIEIDSISYTSL